MRTPPAGAVCWAMAGFLVGRSQGTSAAALPLPDTHERPGKRIQLPSHGSLSEFKGGRRSKKQCRRRETEGGARARPRRPGFQGGRARSPGAPDHAPPASSGVLVVIASTAWTVSCSSIQMAWAPKGWAGAAGGGAAGAGVRAAAGASTLWCRAAAVAGAGTAWQRLRQGGKRARAHVTAGGRQDPPPRFRAPPPHTQNRPTPPARPPGARPPCTPSAAARRCSYPRTRPRRRRC